MLEPVAGFTVLDNQSTLGGGVEEGLSQLIGRHTLLYHPVPPFLVFLTG
jgi:hypothetical protein